MYSLIILYVTRSFGLYASALLAILSSGTLPSPSPNSTFTLITLSGFLWESITTVSTFFFFNPNNPELSPINSICSPVKLSVMDTGITFPFSSYPSFISFTRLLINRFLCSLVATSQALLNLLSSFFIIS